MSAVTMRTVIGLVGGLAGAAAAAAEPVENPVDRYNVVWDCPSKDSSGSMPMGNGDIGLNVWVEEDGDLLFYVSKTDAWSENVRLLKLGRVRIKLSPNPFAKGEPFVQTLRLGRGEVEIRAGKGDGQVRLVVWVDANEPVIRVEAAGEREFGLEAHLDVWRQKDRTLSGKELFSAYGLQGRPKPVVVHPDTVLPGQDGRVVWFHRNERSIWLETMKLQGMEAWAKGAADPLLHRTFGAIMRGAGLVSASPTVLRSAKPKKHFVVSIYPLTSQTDSPEQWLQQLERMVARIESQDPAQAREAHRRWWKSFWDRSWIHVTASGQDDGFAAEAITTTALPIRIGADSDGQNQFRGDIDRARVYGRALRTEEIAAHARGQGLSGGADAGLVGDWTFDQRDGNVFRNAVGEKLPARIVGDVALVDSPGGKAIRLSGKGWVEVAHEAPLALTQACTLEAWVRPGSLPAGGGRIIDKSQAGTANGYLLDTHPGHSLRMIVKAGTLTHDAKLGKGVWSHVAGTYDAKSGRHVLYINGKEVASATRGARQDPYVVSRGYALQRFIGACGGRGAMPIKFNGSIFTVDSRGKDETFDADYRRWGGPYWFQNTRLAYWPMLAAGDFDMIGPLFRMYLDALPMAKARTKLYFGHDGAFFPETMYFWGSYANTNYGWDRKGKDASHVDNRYIRWEYEGALELLAIGLDVYAHTEEKTFLADRLLPLADEVLRFYDKHYKRDEAGVLHLHPAQALETYQLVVNPITDIAGLAWVLDGLLALGVEQIGAERDRWLRRLRKEVPPLPTKEEGDKKRLVPALKIIEGPNNSENPELYPVFPFRLFGVDKPDLETGQRTFAHRRFRGSHGWRQGDIQAALLGLTDEAARGVSQRFATKNSASRFPAFWGPNADWIPDQDHGGVGMVALQKMILQADGGKLYVLPAWPKRWNVQFKLHGPQKTTVEGIYRDGKLEVLKVTPEERGKDVVKMGPLL